MRRRRKQAGPRVDLLPLIDVVFLLLAVFMTSMVSLIRSHSLPVSLPTLATGEQQEAAVSVVIGVGEDGGLSLGGEPSDLAEIEAAVRLRRGIDPELTVFVNADERARHGIVARLFDGLRAVGQGRIHLVGRPVDGASAQ